MFTHCTGVSIVEFEQVNAGWVVHLMIALNIYSCITFPFWQCADDYNISVFMLENHIL